jgi:hypothetical protein
LKSLSGRIKSYHLTETNNDGTTGMRPSERFERQGRTQTEREMSLQLKRMVSVPGKAALSLVEEAQMFEKGSRSRCFRKSWRVDDGRIDRFHAGN